jgi:cytochrome c oxidase subunit 3
MSVTRPIDSPFLGEQYEDLEQQRDSATLGMWVFLATEILFFGGMFLAYAVYRNAYPEAFEKAGREVDVIYGTVNTAVLLTSSLTMVLAVRASQLGRESGRTLYLWLTAVLGSAFLIIKAFEYSEDFSKNFVPGSTLGETGPAAQPMRILIYLYYAMTGLHALHLTIGIVVVCVLALRSSRGKYTAEYYDPIDIGGLYWHFIDLIWVFLYPMFYLINRHH